MKYLNALLLAVIAAACVSMALRREDENGPAYQPLQVSPQPYITPYWQPQEPWGGGTIITWDTTTYTRQ